MARSFAALGPASGGIATRFVAVEFLDGPRAKNAKGVAPSLHGPSAEAVGGIGGGRRHVAAAAGAESGPPMAGGGSEPGGSAAGGFARRAKGNRSLRLEGGDCHGGC